MRIGYLINQYPMPSQTFIGREIRALEDLGVTVNRYALREWDGRLVEQLAFAAARDALDIQLEDLSIDEAGYLAISGRGDRPPMRIQLHDDASLLLNWHAREKRWKARRWETCFKHFPVALVMRIYDARKAIKEKTKIKAVDNENHMGNWLECLRTRKKPNADIEYGHQHAVATILAAAALHTGQRHVYETARREICAG